MVPISFFRVCRCLSPEISTIGIDSSFQRTLLHRAFLSRSYREYFVNNFLRCGASDLVGESRGVALYRRETNVTTFHSFLSPRVFHPSAINAHFITHVLSRFFPRFLLPTFGSTLSESFLVLQPPERDGGTEDR